MEKTSENRISEEKIREWIKENNAKIQKEIEKARKEYENYNENTLYLQAEDVQLDALDFLELAANGIISPEEAEESILKGGKKIARARIYGFVDKCPIGDYKIDHGTLGSLLSYIPRIADENGEFKVSDNNREPPYRRLLYTDCLGLKKVGFIESVDTSADTVKYRLTTLGKILINAFQILDGKERIYSYNQS